MRLTALLFLCIIGFAEPVLTFAGTEEENPAVISIEKAASPIQVGNKYCPVSGEEITEENKIAYEYEGKVYYLCSPECVQEFENSPDEYIEIVEDELKAEGAKEFDRQYQERLKEPEPVSSYNEEHLY